MSTAALLPKLPDYEIERCLARGGMAEIYLARALDGWLRDTEVVLKRLLPQHAHDKAFIDLFIAEARLGQALAHPNVAQTFEIIPRGDELFLVQEYVDGCSLLRLMENASFPMEARLAAFRALLEALCHLQEHRVIHRDINPGNLIVRRDGVCKLIDFGVAEIEGMVHEERAGSLRGTPAYMSPEQVRGKVLDLRSDVFSAGVVLWELLSGRALFRETSEFETMRRICEEDAPQLPDALGSVAAKALARESAQRFESAAALRDAFDALNLSLDADALAAMVEQISPAPPEQQSLPPASDAVDRK